MAKLTARKRNSLATSSFALPESRGYPIPDLNHARNALARAAQFASPAQQARIKAAVYSKYPGLRKG